MLLMLLMRKLQVPYGLTRSLGSALALKKALFLKACFYAADAMKVEEESFRIQP